MTTIIERPLVTFGREICGDLPSAIRREWLVTNGLGGYASGTVAGVLTRRYHGLLVAALSPPTGRIVMVAGDIEWATNDGQRYPLSAHAYQGGTIDPHGYLHLESFSLEGSMPVWRFRLGDALLERRVWMEHGANTTYVRFDLVGGSGPVTLELTPLVTYRDFHSLSTGGSWKPDVRLGSRDVLICAFDGAVPFKLEASSGAVTEVAEWYWSFHHAEESARGLDDSSDLFAPARFEAELQMGEPWTLRISAERDVPKVGSSPALARETERLIGLLTTAGVQSGAAALQQLTLAADQFIAQRRSEGRPIGGSVIAGYHWFNDWGRDTMIALPGLALAAGRFIDAATILREFGRHLREGLLPNNFPDRPDSDPGYNTADAGLWYVWAVHQYLEATGDRSLVSDLLPVLRSIVDTYQRGTRYGIGMDPADVLLRAGETGWQVTWMDAKVSDWVVTPRIGKPIELNALWFNALLTLASFLEVDDPATAYEYRLLAERAQRSAIARFWCDERGYLADVVDGPNGDDWSFRPNQVFAVSLPHPLMNGARAQTLVKAVGQRLLTSYGVRSLAPDDPSYHPHYRGDPLQRDGAYHQGTVWAWLMGPYVEAHFRVFGDRAESRAMLQPFVHHLSDAGLGSISEIFEGDPPHAPRGCIAQAWSVAEVLRVWRMLDESGM